MVARKPDSLDQDKDGQLKMMAEALQISRQTLSLAARAAQLGSWQYQPATGLFEFGEDFYVLHGTEVAREGRFMTPAGYIREFVHPADSGRVKKELVRAWSSSVPRYGGRLEYRLIRRDGRERTVVTQFRVIRDAGGDINRVLGVTQDITGQKWTAAALQRKTEEIKYMAYIDGLTGLPNRTCSWRKRSGTGRPARFCSLIWTI